LLEIRLKKLDKSIAAKAAASHGDWKLKSIRLREWR
jgi:hypothetical protein